MRPALLAVALGVLAAPAVPAADLTGGWTDLLLAHARDPDAPGVFAFDTPQGRVEEVLSPVALGARLDALFPAPGAGADTVSPDDALGLVPPGNLSSRCPQEAGLVYVYYHAGLDLIHRAVPSPVQLGPSTLCGAQAESYLDLTLDTTTVIRLYASCGRVPVWVHPVGVAAGTDVCQVRAWAIHGHVAHFTFRGFGLYADWFVVSAGAVAGGDAWVY